MYEGVAWGDKYEVKNFIPKITAFLAKFFSSENYQDFYKNYRQNRIDRQILVNSKQWQQDLEHTQFSNSVLDQSLPKLPLIPDLSQRTQFVEHVQKRYNILVESSFVSKHGIEFIFFTHQTGSDMIDSSYIPEYENKIFLHIDYKDLPNLMTLYDVKHELAHLGNGFTNCQNISTSDDEQVFIRGFSETRKNNKTNTTVFYGQVIEEGYAVSKEGLEPIAERFSQNLEYYYSYCIYILIQKKISKLDVRDVLEVYRRVGTGTLFLKKIESSWSDSNKALAIIQSEFENSRYTKSGRVILPALINLISPNLFDAWFQTKFTDEDTFQLLQVIKNL